MTSRYITKTKQLFHPHSQRPMKKQFTYRHLLVACVLFLSGTATAATGLDQEEPVKALSEKYQEYKSSKVYEFSVKAGFNIGGTSPMGLPAEIRQINSFGPTLSLSIGGDVIRWFTPKWGLDLGIRFETKGMETNATVKNYTIKLLNDGSYIEGIYTGDVVTKVNNQYLTIPLQATYRPVKRWTLKAGIFASFLLRGNFDGEAKNGYMRTHPTEPKLETDAPYDFSSDIRQFDWGIDAGAEFVAYKHLSIYADLTWGLLPIFPSDFTAVGFKMYNVYLNLGFAYVF